MSYTQTLCNSHLRSDKRSISHKHNHSTHREILSYPARFVELLRSLDIGRRSWVVKLAEKLDHTRVREESRLRSWHDAKERSYSRPSGGRGLRNDGRSISSPRHDGRPRPAQYNLTGSAHQKVPFRSPPLSSRNSRHSRHRDSESHFNPTSRQRQRTPSPSTLRGDPSEYGTFTGHSLRRQGDRRVERSAPWQQPSTPGMSPFKPVPSSTYQHEPYVQSSRSRSTTTPMASYHQGFPPESSKEIASRRRSPSAPRRSIAITQSVDHHPADHPRNSTDLRWTHHSPSRRFKNGLMANEKPRINSDSGEINRPPFVSQDQPKPSCSQIWLRGRRSRTGTKGLKVEIIDSKTYTVIYPRLPRRKPKRTEPPRPRSGHEDRFTDRGYELWKKDVQRAPGEASDAQRKAETLYDYLQCSPSEHL